MSKATVITLRWPTDTVKLFSHFSDTHIIDNTTYVTICGVGGTVFFDQWLLMRHFAHCNSQTTCLSTNSFSEERNRFLDLTFRWGFLVVYVLIIPQLKGCHVLALYQCSVTQGVVSCFSFFLFSFVPKEIGVTYNGMLLCFIRTSSLLAYGLTFLRNMDHEMFLFYLGSPKCKVQHRNTKTASRAFWKMCPALKVDFLMPLLP